MSHTAAPFGLDVRPLAPIAPRWPRLSRRKNAHRGLATCRRPASGETCSQALIASGKNRRSPTTARRSHLLQQSHQYSYKEYTPCSKGDLMSSLMSPGESAPGAPAAVDNSTQTMTLPPLSSLWGNVGQSFLPADFFTPNPIQQNVSVANGQITNTTLAGHIFYPGSVVTTVNQTNFGGSMLQTVGTGSGNYPALNDFLGFLYFGLRNLALQIGCNGAAQPGF